jgi:hypothetical protein
MFELKSALLYFWLPTRTSCRNLAIFSKFFKKKFGILLTPKQHLFLGSLKRKIANLGLRPHAVAFSGRAFNRLQVCFHFFFFLFFQMYVWILFI